MVATESAVSAASAVVTVSGNTVEISITDLSYFQFGVIFVKCICMVMECE